MFAKNIEDKALHAICAEALAIFFEDLGDRSESHWERAGVFAIF
jgi:hypothetical protein